MARWAAVGPLLAEERRLALHRLDDETAREMTRDLLALWRSGAPDRMGEELVMQQRVFDTYRRRVLASPPREK